MLHKKWVGLQTKQLCSEDALSTEQCYDIADLIYDTDKYIYPALFAGQGEPKENARIVLTSILCKGTDEMFKKDNLFLCTIGNRVIGLILWNRGMLKWDCDTFIDEASNANTQLIKENVLLVKNAYIGNRYESNAQEEREYVNLINVCVGSDMRGKGIGSFLIRSFISEHRAEAMKLCVLCDNTSAVRLYKENGFTISLQSPGFSLEERKPLCYEMIRISD